METVTLEMLFKYLDELSVNPPQYRYIKEAFDWFFQVKESKSISKIPTKEEAEQLNQKIISSFSQLAGTDGTSSRIVKNIEDLFK